MYCCRAVRFAARLPDNGGWLSDHPVGGRSYSTFLGGTAADEGLAIQVDAVGNAYVTGGTSSGGAPPAGFPVTAGVVNFTGTTQAFLTKVDPTGTTILLSRSVPAGTLNGT